MAGIGVGVALVYVPMYAILGLFPAAFIIFALNWIVATVGGLSLIDYSGGRPTPGGVVLILVVWLSVSFGLWWVGMYGLIRGWWTDGAPTDTGPHTSRRPQFWRSAFSNEFLVLLKRWWPGLRQYSRMTPEPDA